MDSKLRPFRNLTPMESHGIRTIRYSAAGDMVLIAAGNAQVKIMFFSPRNRTLLTLNYFVFDFYFCFMFSFVLLSIFFYIFFKILFTNH